MQQLKYYDWEFMINRYLNLNCLHIICKSHGYILTLFYYCTAAANGHPTNSEIHLDISNVSVDLISNVNYDYITDQAQVHVWMSLCVYREEKYIIKEYILTLNMFQVDYDCCVPDEIHNGKIHIKNPSY